ncbi:SH3 domain-containing protein [Roseomonas gilardii]|uniref:SH3 domain-containing protein n=1 Tax=Roseomonas gilardii TaxID=257708 RepID=UPI0011AAAE58|nr:SH3 domain-containing protein [Roseomonas gilardii]
MRRSVIISILSLAYIGVAMTTQTSAQSLRAVRPIEGYSCMQLNLTEQQMFDPNAVPAVREEPSPGARRIGSAASVVIIENPVRSKNGFVAMMMPDGKKGWVEASKLAPYRDDAHPATRCTPSVMSNGRIGLDFSR